MSISIVAIKHNIQRRLEGEEIIKQSYRSIFGIELNLKTPKKFSEKLFRRMVMVNRYGNRTYTRLANKILAREYVSKKIGAQYLPEMLWHGKRPEDIPFMDLPEKTIAKTNHGSGGNFVMQKPIDKEAIIAKLHHSLSVNFYWQSREAQYYRIPPRVFVEEFLDDYHANGPLDYRIWCFHGNPEFIQVDDHSHGINPFYDLGWNKLDLSYRQNFLPFDMERPTNLEEMLSIASALSSDFDFVRVDLYSIAGKTYFGELTFSPVAGQFKLNPESWDDVLGAKW
jgi:hypothetical protein